MDRKKKLNPKASLSMKAAVACMIMSWSPTITKRFRPTAQARVISLTKEGLIAGHLGVLQVHGEVALQQAAVKEY